MSDLSIPPGVFRIAKILDAGGKPSEADMILFQGFWKVTPYGNMADMVVRDFVDLSVGRTLKSIRVRNFRNLIADFNAECMERGAMQIIRDRMTKMYHVYPYLTGPEKRRAERWGDKARLYMLKWD